MSMTWAQFVAEVKAHMPVDANRLGVQEYILRQIRAGAIDAQDKIEYYRQGHSKIYKAADITQRNYACSGSLPSVTRGLPDLREVYLRKYAYEFAGAITIASGSVSSNVVTITTDDDHNYSTGDTIRIAGFTDSAVNIDAEITVTGDDTFTYAATTSDGALTEGGDGATANKITSIEWEKVKADAVNWSNRFKMETISCNNASGVVHVAKIAVSPQFDEFYFWPCLIADTYELEIVYDGIVTTFEDADTTPFDEELAHVVSLFAKSRLEAWQGQTQLSDDFEREYVRERLNLWRRRKRMRFVDRV